MKLYGPTQEQLQSVVDFVNKRYGTSMYVVFGRKSWTEAFSFVLRLHFSDSYFHRVTGSGRKMTAVCWHGHKVVMEELFQRYPNARLDSLLARYAGRDSFLDKYADTGSFNIGSAAKPMLFRDACDCGKIEDTDDTIEAFVERREDTNND